MGVEINIDNVVECQPLELARWIADVPLSVKVPNYDSGSTVDIHKVVGLMPQIGNNLILCTQLYCTVVGAKHMWSAAKKNSTTKIEAEMHIVLLTSKVDMLYRTLQTLTTNMEAVRSIISAVKQFKDI